jgi:ParB-like chromosome segregation protein Spo0J
MTLPLFACLPKKCEAGLVEKAKTLFAELDQIKSEPEKIAIINSIKRALHEKSPFRGQPVDCVVWEHHEKVVSNDYNPNSVAPPEMKLLEHSIREDGYTQPIVTWDTKENIEVIDGFHRNRVGREVEDIKARVKGYLPIVIINKEREDRSDRIASTIRHNRARGKHKIEAMSDIVIELKRRNWSDQKIAQNLGMDQDEILRLCQITGLTELFSDQEFSQSWDAEGEVTEADFQELTDDVETYGEEAESFRSVNTSDQNRVFHTYEKWECHKAGFYNTTKPGMTKTQCEEAYRAFLADDQAFRAALGGVITEWQHSCEHYLTNAAMNRIAWLGQASVCFSLGIPSSYRGGFSLLTEGQQKTANETALEYLNRWLVGNGREAVTMEEAYSYERQSDIY